MNMKQPLPLCEFTLELRKQGLVHSPDDGLDDRGILAKRLAEALLVELSDQLLGHNWFLESLSDDERVTGLGHVHAKVVRRTVCAAHAFGPAIRVLDLGVPAVLRVVRHLVAHVLSEAEARGVDPDLREEEVDAHDEVAERLVRDEALGEA